MSWLAYGIIDADSPMPDMAGLERHAVERATAGPIAAAVSSHHRPIVSPTVDHLHAYASVIETLHGRTSVVPIQFGGWAPTAEAIRRHLQQYERPLRAALRRIEGCTEMGLRFRSPTHAAASSPPDEGRGDRSGTSYLAARRARYDRADRSREEKDRIARDVRDALGDCCVESRVRPAGEWLDPTVVGVDFLLRPDGCDPFRRAAEALGERRPEELWVTGPSAPYSFASLGNTTGFGESVATEKP